MKTRLDVLLVSRGLVKSREMAKALIMEGSVFVRGEREDKAGAMFDEDAPVEIRGQKLKYVSRGGLKLEKALTAFDIDVADKVCMDVGSSTGGFTDCMLQNGARLVYAVDVGTNQLDWKLRSDPRVSCMEKTNIRYLQPDQIGEKPEFVTADVAFISLTKVLQPVWELAADGAQAVVLIKPQFEAGREKVGKKGVVRDKDTHIEVIENVLSYARTVGYDILGLDFSPIKGPEGNIEYLAWLEKTSSPKDADAACGGARTDIERIVNEAHSELA